MSTLSQKLTTTVCPTLSTSSKVDLVIKQPKMADFRLETSAGADNLIQAVTEGKIQKVRHLLRHGASLTSKSVHGLSPLVAALHIEDAKKRQSMFLMLLKQGVDYTQKDSHLRSVMHWAGGLGQNEQVFSLLEETAGGINLSEKDKDGLTALHHAVLAGSLATVNVLVDFHVRFGVAVDVTDNLGLTPYIYARRLGHKEIAQVLRIKGLACEDHADNLFRSPREWSTIGKTERKKALNCEIQDQLKTAQIMGKFNFIKVLESSMHVTSLKTLVQNDISKQDHVLHKRKPLNHTLQSSLHLSETLTGNSTVCTSSIKTQLNSSAELTTYETNPESSLIANIFEHNAGATTSSHSNQLSSDSVKGEHVKTVSQTSLTFPMSNKYQIQKVTSHHQQQHFPSSSPKTDLIVNCSKQLNEISSSSGHASPALKTSNLDALLLIEQTFPKGRIVNEFHNSVFDRNKMAEYKYMFGNLNSLMAILSEQNTKSFKKSVMVQRPVTPKTPLDNKNKCKISTWAILFGEQKDNKRRKAKPIHSSLAKRQNGSKEQGCKKEKTQHDEKRSKSRL